MLRFGELQVSFGIELLCGINAALPYGHCISTNDFHACCLSPQLWLALGRIFIGRSRNIANRKLGRRGSHLSKLSTTVIRETPQKSSSRVHNCGTLYRPTLLKEEVAVMN
ncbi:hypothetical protein HN51_054381 [Arachis hypogaea]|nr:uncharacterized protein LOC107618769 [Arachis ipaensis]XP_020966544.1 uncharacterized protein LOC107618769 [Arachis ipaensis]